MGSPVKRNGKPSSLKRRPPDLHLVLSGEVEGISMQKCERNNNLDMTMTSAFTPAANVPTAAKKARGMLYFIYTFMYFYIYNEGDFRTSKKRIAETTSRIRHSSKLSYI